MARDAADYADYRELLERHQREVRQYTGALEHLEEGDPKPEAPRPFTIEMATYSSWFGYVKNGMRFPTEVRTIEVLPNQMSMISIEVTLVPVDQSFVRFHIADPKGGTT